MLISCLILGVMFFAGCSSGESTEAIEESIPQEIYEIIINEFILEFVAKNFPKELWNTFTEEEQQDSLNAMAKEFIKYSSIKNLSHIPEIDNAAVLVNGEPITTREIKTQNLLVNGLNGKEPLDEIITQMIRRKITMQEAIRLELKPNQQIIDNHMEIFKQMLHYPTDPTDSNYSQLLIMAISFKAQIEWLGITEAEFLSMEEKNTFESNLGGELMTVVSDLNSDLIVTEAEKRGIPPADVTKEFFERYVDDLVARANIKILDPEIEAILSTVTPKP